MTYSTSNPPALISQRVGANSGAVWMYVTTDSLATVAAIGYITNAADLGIKSGDKLIHVDSTNNVNTSLTFVAPTTGTAAGATCSAVEPIGETSIALSSAGTGTIVVGDIINFGNDTTNYRVTTGDSDVSNGGTIVITPALVVATAVGTAITVRGDTLTLKGGAATTLTVATTLVAADSGGTFFLGTAGGFTVTLPTPFAGANYKFIASVAPTTAYIIATSGSANIISGVVSSSDLNGATDTSIAALSDTITFAANKALKGDWVELVSDGTGWFLSGCTSVFDGIVGTQAT